MKPRLIFLLSILFCFGTIQLKSQSVTPDVVATTGDFYANGSGQIQWTIGEVMVETYQSVNNFVTQGFHQPNNGVLTAVPNDYSLSNVLLYPNPATDYVSFDFGSAEGTFTIELFDMLGNKISTDNFSSANNSSVFTLSTQNLSNAFYFVRISNPSTGSSHSFKIIVSQ